MSRLRSGFGGSWYDRLQDCPMEVIDSDITHPSAPSADKVRGLADSSEPYLVNISCNSHTTMTSRPGRWISPGGSIIAMTCRS